MPVLKKANVNPMAGVFVMTPDQFPLIGRVFDLPNYWVATGALYALLSPLTLTYFLIVVTACPLLAVLVLSSPNGWSRKNHRQKCSTSMSIASQAGPIGMLYALKCNNRSSVQEIYVGTHSGVIQLHL